MKELILLRHAKSSWDYNVEDRNRPLSEKGIDRIIKTSKKNKGIFKDTDYSLEKVRETKIVKPVALSLLPEEMKMIASTQKRKTLFIQIILPLILEENNKIKLDRKKLFSILNKNKNSKLEKRWINEKFKQYGVFK